MNSPNFNKKLDDIQLYTTTAEGHLKYIEDAYGTTVKFPKGVINSLAKAKWCLEQIKEKATYK